MVQEIRKRGVAVSLQAFAACMVVYFGYHAVQGERGFLSYVKLNKELAQIAAQEAAVSKERRELETQVAGLRPESLDLDLLDERARLLLNYGGGDEAVVWLGEASGESAVEPVTGEDNQ
ncbi:septum formation initiator family protein [Limibacillus sp. MBR-115]|jgi:cell division protein FtsB|uniref:FtsB family cell division protein n=1 Tax=Limibacillus sp. MBR-115 TaxID=3156465 RepID=UPI0033964B2C